MRRIGIAARKFWAWQVLWLLLWLCLWVSRLRWRDRGGRGRYRGRICLLVVGKWRVAGSFCALNGKLNVLGQYNRLDILVLPRARR